MWRFLCGVCGAEDGEEYQRAGHQGHVEEKKQKFRVAYKDESGELIDDPQLCKARYLKGWFVTDILACSPLPQNTREKRQAVQNRQFRNLDVKRRWK
ncbi:hypothetical protein M758_UG020800 [Ceratodon purpureus]|nr:hypothetical protein M758_UG020800 [Ceratodon purpureus]